MTTCLRMWHFKLWYFFYFFKRVIICLYYLLCVYFHIAIPSIGPSTVEELLALVLSIQTFLRSSPNKAEPLISKCSKYQNQYIAPQKICGPLYNIIIIGMWHLFNLFRRSYPYVNRKKCPCPCTSLKISSKKFRGSKLLYIKGRIREGSKDSFWHSEIIWCYRSSPLVC